MVLDYLPDEDIKVSMLIDNFGIISQVEWHVKTRQNQDIFEAKM